MRTYKTEQQTREVSVIESVECDKCHKLIEMDEHWFAGVSVVVDAGYGSRYDNDLNETNPTFDLCDDCAGVLLGELGWQEIDWSEQFNQLQTIAAVVGQEQFEQQQTPEAKAGMKAAFDATPEQLGEAAVREAKKDQSQ